MATERPVALITYDGLPISSGGSYTQRTKDRRVIWGRMRRFLDSFTTSGGSELVRLLLAQGPHVDDRFFARAARAATRAFGTSRRRTVVGGALREREHAWMLRSSQIDEALALMDELEPIPEYLRRCLLVVGIEQLFSLRDPHTGEELSGQGAELYGTREQRPTHCSENRASTSA